MSVRFAHPAVPSTGDLEGWYVRVVSTGYGHNVTSDCVSHNELLRMVGNASADYGYRPQSSRVADRTYRWTWEERDDSTGMRWTEMIIASKIV